jgi:4-hydroxy-3-methylbut-2-enyl diphosphate reductase
MKVLLARPRGYCAGVEMALAALDAALVRFGAPIHCYHQIVHNRYLVAHYESRGVVFVDDVARVPAGSVVVFSAHGVAPAVREQARAQGLTVVDATCPLVAKVHAEARQFDRAGFTIVLVGHRGHDETVGVQGEAPDAVVVVENEADVERLVVTDPARVAYVTQTTLSVDDTRQVIDALRRRFPLIRAPAQEDICYATQNRQEAVRHLSAWADVAIVIGSANSSNSRRLAEVAEARGARAYLVDGPDDIDPSWLVSAKTVVLTAGASVPEALVEKTLGWLRERFGALIEQHVVREEHVRFNLPLEVRSVVSVPVAS